jgi:hypothetical protein
MKIGFRGATCAIEYSLRFELVRKGLRRNESSVSTYRILPFTLTRICCSVTVPIWYLPKSRPQGAPLLSIPFVALKGHEPPHPNILGLETVIIEPQRSCRLYVCTYVILDGDLHSNASTANSSCTENVQFWKANSSITVSVLSSVRRVGRGFASHTSVSREEV